MNEFNQKDKEQTLQRIIRVKDIFLASVAIIVTVLNLWLASKLSPLVTDIQLNRRDIEANAKDIEECKIDLKSGMVRIETKIDSLNNKLDRHILAD